MKPKISVVMSVYNGEKYLNKSMDSILNQTFKDFEFIIIDDCSTDKSYQILERYRNSDTRIKLIRKNKNIGVKGFIKNLNLGIKEARGQYIARMDQDDIAELNRLEKQYNFLVENPDTYIVGSNLALIDEEGALFGEMIAPLSDRVIRKKMIKKISLFHPVIMFRNTNEFNYREKMLYCEDYDLYLRMITKEISMANLPEKLLQYRIHGQSISRKDNKFTRRLFVEKCKQFYFERKRTGGDSYNIFNAEDFLKLSDDQYPSTFKDLLFGLNVCLKYKYKNDFKNILVKLMQQYPEKNYGLYNFVQILPTPAFNMIAKLYKVL